MYASGFRNCAFTERNRMGGARKKRGGQKPQATLRREIHAAQEALEARAGARGYFSFAYSVLASLRTGMSGSASFQSVRKS